MRKRIFMLVVLALMVVAAMALSGVAQAASPRAKCQQEAASLGSLDGYTFIYGNNKNNVFTDTAGQPEVFCGLGGDDSIDTLEAGDIFIGGAGNDSVNTNYGTFNGGDGTDSVVNNYTNFGSTLDSVEVVGSP
jgi:hypothetical protein